MTEMQRGVELKPADSLHAELRILIASSRQRLAGAVNAELTRLYWSVGKRLHTEVLGGVDRAKYGDQLVKRVGDQLAQGLGRGFEAKNLRRRVQFALAFPDVETAAHKGQMELYLKWLDKHERQAGEEAPIGLILCAESSREQVELLQMHKDGITVAEYWTELRPKAELEQHLHQALIKARERLARRGVLLAGGENE